ncbi:MULTISPECIES: hypothetical protein [unclassified Halorhabdus]|uniref:hypothetical protein n=1 Tax=unclassified Halorhabdus TaxID=2621901 RepID=UPI0023D9C020|nr:MULTISPECIES: hypothetical protein [unclassified Halorhabdus]WEL17350.1 Uncharacterized protein SVXHr_1177 [Halorhabdus sp. SVX81]WEL21232.1 Uncharacterized protein HBNXHr_1165 [Halorhabdus sp. BNX81]
MTDDAEEPTESDGESGDDEQSFRERVEEIRQERAEEGSEDMDMEDRRERMEEAMGGGGPGGMGGGNPFAQMMSGMMGGGPGGPGGRGPGQMGPEDESETGGNEELTREVRKLRDEVHDVRRELGRIADALEE